MNRAFHDYGLVFVWLIFSLFAALVLIVLMLGAGIYKQVAEISQRGYEERTCLAYVWTKVKSCDGEDKVAVGDFQGQSMLLLEEEYDGAAYHTLIYHYEGWVRELFCEEGLAFAPEDGTAVLEAESLTFTAQPGALIEVMSGGYKLLLYLGEGGSSI